VRPYISTKIDLPDFVLWYTEWFEEQTVASTQSGEGMQVFPTIDPEVRPDIAARQQAGVDIRLTNRFTYTLGGQFHATLPEFNLEYSYGGGVPNTFKDVPYIVTNTVRETTFYKGAQMVCYIPKNTNPYKFKDYELAAGATQATKVFLDAKAPALLHVCKGSVTINGATIGHQEFFQYDATKSVDIVATEESVVIISVQV
jgi:hypothetical protein